MSKHTPGPWYLGEYAEVYGPVGYGQIAGMSPNSNIEQRKANARLIAAAPDLLEALQIVVNDWTAQFERNGHLAPSWCKQARAAIAKAGGNYEQP